MIQGMRKGPTSLEDSDFGLFSHSLGRAPAVCAGHGGDHPVPDADDTMQRHPCIFRLNEEADFDFLAHAWSPTK